MWRLPPFSKREFALVIAIHDDETAIAVVDQSCQERAIDHQKIRARRREGNQFDGERDFIRLLGVDLADIPEQILGIKEGECSTPCHAAYNLLPLLPWNLSALGLL